MGCASSKQAKKCRHCETPYPPMSRRSFSMNVHHPPEKRGDTYHVVALTSSTLDSIRLERVKNSISTIWDEFEEEKDDQKTKNNEMGCDKTKEFTMGMIQAKAWSKMIDEKITKVVPKTPIRTPPGEPENINVNELMEGLEGTSPLRLGEHLRSFSFHVANDSLPSLVDSPRMEGGCQENGVWLPKGLVKGIDQEVISDFRKALEELPPTNPFYLKPRDGIDEENLNEVNLDEVAQEKKHGFMDKVTLEEEKENLAPLENGDVNGYPIYPKKRVVLYFTSLRGVRKTYEDCCYVRLTLKGLGVRVDERDVSMHLGFKEELKELLSEGLKGGLPKVFVGDKYIGGMEEIRRLHEDGKLEKVVEDCEKMEEDGGNLIEVCEACGDIRFIPCETCSGSCKIYYECEAEDDEEYEEDEYGFQRCPDCNENGLIRCPICCY